MPDATIRMLGPTSGDEAAFGAHFLGATAAPAAGQVLDDDTLIALHDTSTLPWLRVNFISSVDGAVARDGRSGGLGTPADRRMFGLLRRLADVIIVGAGTVRVEGYSGPLLSAEDEEWRLARGLTAHPEFAIVSHRLDLDPASDLFTRAVRRPLIIAPLSASEERRSALAEVADVIDCGDASVDLVKMRALLAERGLQRQHSEGGPAVFTAMLAAGIVDEVCLTVTPQLVVGDAGRITAPGPDVATDLRLAHTLCADDGTLLLRYTRA